MTADECRYTRVQKNMSTRVQELPVIRIYQTKLNLTMIKQAWLDQKTILNSLQKTFINQTRTHYKRLYYTILDWATIDKNESDQTRVTRQEQNILD